MNWIKTDSIKSAIPVIEPDSKWINPYRKKRKRGRPSKADLELMQKAYEWECENGHGIIYMLHQMSKQGNKIQYKPRLNEI